MSSPGLLDEYEKSLIVAKGREQWIARGLLNTRVQLSSPAKTEVIAATLKKYNVGVLVGTKTKGWGTVEKAFNLENQIDPNEDYSI